MFNFGRYLLIASSHSCDLPANLQGVWNPRLDPPWNSYFHQDINLQMNYWPAEVCRLPECVEPLLTFVERKLPHGRQVARKLYNCRVACTAEPRFAAPTPALAVKRHKGGTLSFAAHAGMRYELFWP